ncbi:MAG: threonine/serine exporter family protein [Lachnospiraceae bacterium]|nr:threonine/serine exporter family protein [Lachnospiraceae bacterium]
MVENIKLILFSFTASFGFGIVFHIKKEYLIWAGLGGALTRLSYLLLLEIIDKRFVYTLLAAIIASLYAEIMALELKTPSTVFLYPAIIPLIPGGLLYNTAVNFFLHETALMLENARDCALTLVGMSIGFVLISTFTYYRRVYFFSKDIASHFLHYSHRKNS